MMRELFLNKFRVLTYVLFLLIPFIYFDSTIDPVLYPRQMVVSIWTLLMFCLLFVTKNEGKSKSLPVSACLFAVFFVFSACFVFFSSNLSESVAVVSRYASFVALFMVLYLLLKRNLIQYKDLFISVSLFHLAILIMLCWDIATQIETQVFNVVALKSTIANKNLLSSLLYLCLPFAVIQLQKSKRIIKVLQIVLIVFTLIVLWVLQSKATLIAVLVLITGAMGYFLKSVRGRKRKYGVLAGSILLIGLFGFVSTNYQQQFRYLTNANSVHLRLKLWDNSWQMYKENPLGVGAGNWKLSFPKYGLDKFEHERFVQGRTHFQRPHNDFLSVLCETGPIGLCLFQGFFLIVVYQGFKLLSVNNEYQFRHWCLFLGIVGYMIIMFIDFPFERIEHQMILFSIFALITVRFEKEFLSKQFASPKLVLLMGILLSIFSVIISMYRIVGEQNTHDIIQYHTKGKWGKLTKSVQNTMGKFYEMDPMATPLPWYEGVAHFSSGNFKKALESFEHAYEIHPNHIHVLNNLGSTLEKNGKRKEAIEHYRKALQISPFFEESRLNLSALYFNNQEYDLAFQIIDSCSVTSQNAKYPPFLNAILAKFAEAHNDQIPSEVLAQGNLIEHYKRRKADGKSFLGLD